MLKFSRISFQLGLVLLFSSTQKNVWAQETYRPADTQPVASSFLIVAPDARSGGMGDASVAVSPDANAIFNNASKLAFIEENSGISFSYNPWMQNLSSDVSLSYANFFTHINDRTVLAGSFKYFNMGKVQLTDNQRNSLGEINPKDFSLDLSLAQSYGPNFSLGFTGKYVYSNLASGQVVNGQEVKAAHGIAADISAFYQKKVYWLRDEATWSSGISISNIGTKMGYLDNGNKAFLPMNLKLGTALTSQLGSEAHEITFAFDINKLLTPTEPIYGEINAVTGERSILSGKDPNRSVANALFTSFSDAPGGFSEELKEINYSFGTEYWYHKLFAMRAGYMYQNPNKGNLQALSLGLGVRYSSFSFNFAYVIPTQSGPFANAIRFTVFFHTTQKSNPNRGIGN